MMPYGLLQHTKLLNQTTKITHTLNKGNKLDLNNTNTCIYAPTSNVSR